MSEVIVEKNYQQNQHIALVQLNRPKALNALSNDLVEQIMMRLIELDEDRGVRVIILTGHKKAFAAGADLGQMVEASAIDQFFHRRARIVKTLNQIRTPTIAAVSGFALGGGLELAMTADMIIASDCAKFGQPEVKVGTLPGAGGTQRLTKAIGKSKAMMMCLTGEMIDAQTAYDWNLVARIVPEKALLQESFETAKKIAQLSPVATQLAKEAVNKSFEMSLSEGMDFERRNFYLSFASQDQKEGMSAFIEKRNPEYKGS